MTKRSAIEKRPKDPRTPDTKGDVTADVPASRGREEELESFYRDHAARVLAWAIRLGGPSTDPEDIAQEVFAIALRRLDTFAGDSALSTWLFGITRKVVANGRRKAALRRFVGLGDLPELPSAAPGADEAVDRLRRRRQVQLALERLSRSHREAIALVDLEGMSAVDAAELLGVPTGTVYSRLHAGRRAFARALQRQGVVAASFVLDGGAEVSR